MALVKKIKVSIVTGDDDVIEMEFEGSLHVDFQYHYDLGKLSPFRSPGPTKLDLVLTANGIVNALPLETLAQR